MEQVPPGDACLYPNERLCGFRGEFMCNLTEEPMADLIKHLDCPANLEDV